MAERTRQRKWHRDNGALRPVSHQPECNESREDKNNEHKILPRDFPFLRPYLTVSPLTSIFYVSLTARQCRDDKKLKKWIYIHLEFSEFSVVLCEKFVSPYRISAAVMH